MEKYHKIIEGLLFLSGEEGISVEQLQQALELSEVEIIEILASMQQALEADDTRGIMLVCLADQYKFVTKSEIYDYAQKIYEQTKKQTLSSAALETLAIIAYKQPITRTDIEKLRGVGCEMMLKKLMGRELIYEVGRSEHIGKPFLYGVTQNFLDTFKLANLNELPEINFEVINQELFD